jgi:hypothetical protein
MGFSLRPEGFVLDRIETLGEPLVCLPSRSEVKANTELDLTFGQGPGKAQWLAGRKTGRAVCAEWRTKGSADNIVDPGRVGSVGDVERFCWLVGSSKPQTLAYGLLASLHS